MASSEKLFEAEWQDFFRDVLQDDEVQERLRTLMTQREGLVKRVSELGKANGRSIAIRQATDAERSKGSFVAKIIAKAGLAGRQVTEKDVREWMISAGHKWSVIEPV